MKDFQNVNDQSEDEFVRDTMFDFEDMADDCLVMYSDTQHCLSPSVHVEEKIGGDRREATYHNDVAFRSGRKDERRELGSGKSLAQTAQRTEEQSFEIMYENLDKDVDIQKRYQNLFEARVQNLTPPNRAGNKDNPLNKVGMKENCPNPGGYFNVQQDFKSSVANIMQSCMRSGAQAAQSYVHVGNTVDETQNKCGREGVRAPITDTFVLCFINSVSYMYI